MTRWPGLRQTSPRPEYLLCGWRSPWGHSPHRPRARYQLETISTLQGPLKILTLASPNPVCLLPLPCPFLPTKTPIKAFVAFLPCSLCLLTNPTASLCGPVWPAKPAAPRDLLPPRQSFPHFHVLPYLMETNPKYPYHSTQN